MLKKLAPSAIKGEGSLVLHVMVERNSRILRISGDKDQAAETSR
jgi:hypothetical protein